MHFCKGTEDDFDIVYQMMLRARERLFQEHIYQWDERYPKPEMIENDLKHGYTFLVKNDEKEVAAFFTANSICEDDVHDSIRWIYTGPKWIILHRLCVDPPFQNAGTGQRILTLFEKKAAEDLYDSIRIDVFSTNQKAIHIYEKFGYTRVGEAVCERGPFFVYEKKLKD